MTVPDQESVLFEHPCDVCGERGILGVGVFLRQGKTGMWWCAACFPGPEEAQQEFDAAERLKQGRSKS